MGGAGSTYLHYPARTPLQVNSKDKLLGQSRSQHQSALSERDQLRIELGRLGGTFRDKQDVVDEQIAEVSVNKVWGAQRIDRQIAQVQLFQASCTQV